MKLKIITVPNPNLRLTAKKIPKLDSKATQFALDLVDTLVNHDPPGIGLAAPQVDKLWRVFVTNLPKDQLLPDKWSSAKMQQTIFINPVITDVSPKKTLSAAGKKVFLEGCLSIPNIWGPVYRHQWIELEYTSLATPPEWPDGLSGGVTKIRQRFTDLHARIIQHEYDHLDGILFTDHSLADNLPLSFDTGDKLEPIKNPEAILKW